MFSPCFRSGAQRMDLGLPFLAPIINLFTGSSSMFSLGLDINMVFELEIWHYYPCQGWSQNWFKHITWPTDSRIFCKLLLILWIPNVILLILKRGSSRCVITTQRRTWEILTEKPLLDSTYPWHLPVHKNCLPVRILNLSTVASACFVLIYVILFNDFRPYLKCARSYAGLCQQHTYRGDICYLYSHLLLKWEVREHGLEVCSSSEASNSWLT